MTTPTRILMLGPDPSSPGGIASVINLYRAAGLFDRWPIQYVPTTTARSGLQKAAMFLRALRQVLVLLLRGSVSAIHIHTASYHSFWRKSFFIALGIGFRVPVIVHLHGGAFVEFYRGTSAVIRTSWILPLLSRTAAIVVLSRTWHLALQEIIPDVPIKVIENPVIPPEPSQARGSDLSLPVILFLGRLEAAKGIWDLFSACAQLQQDGVRFHLVCAGPGEMEEARLCAERLHITKSLELPGWIEGAEKHHRLSHTTVLVLPSYHEGLPMSLLEAMAYGIPVIATGVGGIPDLVKHGHNGLLITPGDVTALTSALTQVLTSSEIRSQLGEAGRATILDSHTPARILDQLNALYTEIGLRPQPSTYK